MQNAKCSLNEKKRKIEKRAPILFRHSYVIPALLNIYYYYFTVQIGIKYRASGLYKI